MSIGLIGRKVGMTQVFQDDGTMVAVSVLAIEPNTVTRLRTTDRDGYTAVQLGTDGGRKLTKPLSGQLKNLPKGAARPATLREFRVETVDEYELGQQLKADVFQIGEKVEVVGVSKGKGFQGGVKRHGFRGGADTHGSMFHRAPGSIGASSYPSRVFPGQHLPGHMGVDRVTAKRLAVVGVYAERGLLLVKGAVPGAPRGIVMITAKR